MLKYISRMSAAAATLLATLLVGTATAQDLKQVTIAYSNPTMVQGTNLIYIPEAMGYWREQGYDVRLVPGRDSTTTVQQLVGGNADIIMLNTSPVIAANAQTEGNVRSLIISSYTAWRVFALGNSGLKNLADFKGKTIGTPTVAGGGNVYVLDGLRKAGLDPDKDVRFVVVGYGAQALEALTSGRVDALLTFQISAAPYIAQGIDLNIIYDEEWVQFPDHGFATLATTAEKDEDMVRAIARGFVMAQVFEQANPECSARIYHKNYVRELTPEVERINFFAAKISQEQRLADFKRANRNGGELWSAQDLEGLEKLQAFMKANGMLEETFDVNRLVIDLPNLVEEANNFDHERVKQEAIACAGF